MYPEDRDEADTADDEREDVGTFVAYLMLDGREEGCPDEGADSLYGEAYAHPVACVLESTCGSVHTIPAEALGSDGAAFSDGGNDLIFPGEVSADKDMITIKPIMVKENPYYPCAGFNYYGQFWGPDTYVNSNLTLSRGWTEPEEGDKPATKAGAAKADRNGVRVLSGADNAIPMLRKTPLKSMKDYKKVSYKVVNKDMFLSNIQKNRNNLGK